jgi:hypothetical protein
VDRAAVFRQTSWLVLPTRTTSHSASGVNMARVPSHALKLHSSPARWRWRWSWRMVHGKVAAGSLNHWQAVPPSESLPCTYSKRNKEEGGGDEGRSLMRGVGGGT